MLHHLKAPLYFAALTLTLALTASCEGDDRRGEQPFAPTVKTTAATVTDRTLVLSGQIISSPNSTVRACGFHCGNDTARFTLPADIQPTFTLTIDTLLPGHYYAVAYATNGIGTSTGDTLHFDIPTLP